jgi:SulP family sulfate permease
MNKQALISNILAGVLIGIMNITVAISIAALIFSGTHPSYLSAGIVMLLVGTLVIGLWGTMFSGFGGVICAPRSGLAPVFAAMIAAIYSASSSSSPQEVLVTMIITIIMASVVTGLFLILLGKLRLGNLVRYIPYPVMGGFFAGIGYIFVKGGLTVAMGKPPEVQTFHNVAFIQLAIPAIIFAILLYIFLKSFKHWSAFPLFLIVGFVLFYAAAFLSGATAETLVANGWLPKIDAPEGIQLPLVSLRYIEHIDWWLILGQAGAMLVVALLSAIILLLDISGIEIITNLELDPDKELRTMGYANVVSGLAGGYPGVHVASDTAFTYKLGGDNKIMGIVYALAIFITILAGTGFIGKVPTYILGGLLIYVGIDFLTDWVWNTRKELPLSDYAIVWIILIAIALFDILQGVAFGFSVAVVLFVISYSRLSIIKSEASGHEHGSNIDRDLLTREKLNERGESILILMLQGYIFFGTSSKLLNEIRQRIHDRKIEFLVMDFHHVSQLDTSAIMAFKKLGQLSEKHHFHVIVTAISDEDTQKLKNISFFTTEFSKLKRGYFDTMDEGVAWCEEFILKELNHSVLLFHKELISLLYLITQDEAAANELAGYFNIIKKKKDEYLFKQGEPGDSMYLVANGSITVVIESAGRTHVVRRYQSGAILGEMAIYTGEPRSASVIIEDDAVLYELDAKKHEAMQRTHPVATGKFHSYIVRLLSERLNRANLELQRYL